MSGGERCLRVGLIGLGAVGFLQKPYALKDLLGAVRGALEPGNR